MVAVGQRRPLKPAPFAVLNPLIEKGGTMGLCAEADRCWAWRTGQFWSLAVAEESMLLRGKLQKAVVVTFFLLLQAMQEQKK